MKVIHILNELKFSGAEIMYVDAAPVFRQSGCSLSVVNTTQNLGDYAPYFERAGYSVFHLPYPSWKKPLQRAKYCIGFVKFLKRESYDVVHIHSHRMMWTMAFCAWMAGVRSVYTFHSVFTARRVYIYLYRYMTRLSAKHVFRCTFHTISNSVYRHEKNYFHNKTVKINNWYGTARFYPAAGNEKASVRKELNIPENAPVIISVGGCSPVKRHTDIIKALPEITARLGNTVYLHLGEGASLREERALSETLQMSGHTVFCGNRTDVRRYLIASDIYVMTSLYEGIPLTAIEAMSCGIPAVLYNVPGLRDFNDEGECALLTGENNPQALARSIISLYEDKEKQRSLTERAKHLTATQFDMATNAAKIFELYTGNGKWKMKSGRKIP
ncbi:MAG: glycosyltransferase [Bacteroidales bacterium]|jgi:glycosyltransferase involved in cell wall biosynthesis|nr:glycosyltransferase [Bacteroidales bacterium]